MTIKTVLVLIVCIMIAGCASLLSVEDNQTERQVIDIYDNQGKVKEHIISKMIILRFMIRIGRQRGMERCNNSLSTRIIQISYNLLEKFPGDKN